jgi:hypothetical protein
MGDINDEKQILVIWLKEFTENQKFDFRRHFPLIHQAIERYKLRY